MGQQDAPPVSPVILLADDEDGSRLVLATSLRRAGFEVLEAACGLEALALFDANAARIRLLITDVMMPDLRGPEVPALPVLYITGYGERQGIDQDDLLMHKPFMPSSFVAAVRKLLH